MTGMVSRTCPSVVMPSTVGQTAHCQLPQAVVESIQRLDRCGRIEERRVRQGPLGHVDEHPEPVRDVLLERSFQPGPERIERCFTIEACRITLDTQQRRS